MTADPDLAQRMASFGLEVDDGATSDDDAGDDGALREQLPDNWIDPAQIGRYQIVPLNEDLTLLFDSATGQTWNLHQSVHPSYQWRAVKRVEE